MIIDHVIRIGDLKAARVNMKINVEGKKGSGSLKKKLVDRKKNFMKKTSISKKDVANRALLCSWKSVKDLLKLWVKEDYNDI